MVALSPPPPLVCLDPGHGTPAAIGRQLEPIGPGSTARKIKDGGGAPGEAPVALAIALKTRTLLTRSGYRVAMTRPGSTYTGGNVQRAQFCNARHAALMIRIHADGSTDTSLHGIRTLLPALRKGWTDDIYTASLRAARGMKTALVRATGARDLGLMPRSDLTGFNWANVPVILVEAGFMSNPRERRLLRSGAYQLKVARGLVAGTVGFIAARPQRKLQTALASCRLTNFALQFGAELSPATGQNPQALRLQNEGPRCVLFGYPRVVVRDRAGVIPVVINHRGDMHIGPRPPRQVDVRRGGHAFIVLNQYRCDLGTLRSANLVRLGPLRAWTQIRIKKAERQVHYCGRGDPGSILTVSPFVARVRDALWP
jgi:N-acetylmuramoyl-L-alanine amidase